MEASKSFKIKSLVCPWKENPSAPENFYESIEESIENLDEEIEKVNEEEIIDLDKIKIPPQSKKTTKYKMVPVKENNETEDPYAKILKDLKNV